jgi:predicted flap endonuclease-1-like 5' DNA nuclease
VNVRTASRRGRRLGGLLLLAATVCWVLLRRRASAVRWVEPPASVPAGGAPDEPGAPGELPDDVLATDAGLTELPEAAAGETPSGTVDETRVAELLAETPDAEVVVVDETSYERAVADAAPEPPPEPAGELPQPGPAADEPTDPALVRPAVDEETDTEIPMPTFSEMPTMELPAFTDDLRAVRGIGPSMERKLHALGIVSYRQLALLDGAQLERVRAELTDFRTRIEREDWVGQARALHREKYGRDPS